MKYRCYAICASEIYKTPIDTQSYATDIDIFTITRLPSIYRHTSQTYLYFWRRLSADRNLLKSQQSKKMASEDLFQNDFSEEPDLGQDVQQSEDMNMEAEEEIDADVEDEKTDGDNNTSAVNGDSPTAASESADDATKTS